jgi:hypothetical protein
MTSGHKLRSGPIQMQNLGHPEGTQHPGVLFLGYFLLDKQKKVTCRGSATHAVYSKTDSSHAAITLKQSNQILPPVQAWG